MFGFTTKARRHEEPQLPPIELEEIRRLSIRPGDVLVLRVNRLLCHEDIERMRARMNLLFPNVRTLVLERDMQLDVVALLQEKRAPAPPPAPANIVEPH